MTLFEGNQTKENTLNKLLSWTIGNAKITKIPELDIHNVPASFLFPQWNDDEGKRALIGLGKEFTGSEDTHIELSTHSWLIETDEFTFLIDTAAGNDKSRPLNPGFHQLNTGWLQHLLNAGAQPKKVDFVFLSHLHVDHVGWNTRLTNGLWVPTFPDARYYFSAREFEYYSNEENVEEPSKGIFADSILPVTQAGLDVQIDAGDVLPVPGLQIHQTPGHSHDHWSFSFSSEGETAFFCGDVMHHPLQLRRPEWHSVYCEDMERSVASRRWAIEFALKNDAAVFTTHFPGSSAGRLKEGEQGLEWHSL